MNELSRGVLTICSVLDSDLRMQVKNQIQTISVDLDSIKIQGISMESAKIFV